jgi:hypothetical protein
MSSNSLGAVELGRAGSSSWSNLSSVRGRRGTSWVWTGKLVVSLPGIELPSKTKIRDHGWMVLFLIYLIFFSFSLMKLQTLGREARKCVAVVDPDWRALASSGRVTSLPKEGEV